MKKRVLILCTHNSSRSQMAEGLLRAAAGNDIEVESAGTEATRVHPLAIAAMAERGIDITGHTSKTLDRFLHQPWDDIITVCDSANETCPVFPRAGRRIHWSFEDPSQATGSEEARLAMFRRIRDEIDARLTAWLTRERVGG
jgi:arsenate reductase